MKVAFCVPMDLTSIGGVEMHIRQLARALRKLHLHIDVFARVPDRGSQAWECLNPNEYDILHTHAGLFHSDFVKITCRRRFHQRHVHTLHGVSLDYLLNCRAWLNWRCYTSTFFEGLLSRYADHVICVSNNIQLRARQCFGIPWEKMTVIYNGYTPADIPAQNRATLRDQWELTPEMTLGIFVGRADDPVKGAAAVTAAMNELYPRFPKLRLLAVPGDGFRNFPWLIRSGPVEYEKISEYYAAADIFVNASLNEGMPLTVIEAMAARLPIVAAPVGGIPEIITHNQTGLLLKPNRSDLMKQLQKLIEDPPLRRLLGQNAQHAAQNLTWNHIARQTAKIYNDLLT
jgi:glycosyltransferase involved in cell wall biosynthesis